MIGSEVSIERISKNYGTVSAVESVSFAVEPGEFVSLLGPSGSGKTTLLMMIAGFELPSAGLIRVGTRDLTYVPPNKRNIGMVFQKYALFPHMTVAENIGFPLRMRKVDRAEIARRVDTALALVRLEAYGSRMPSQLSGGQQQRVAVARALVFEPPVLLMDEPLGALDKKLRGEMQFEIKSLQQRLGLTVIYVTHDQEEALTMSDRVALMSEGKLAQIGSPLELYEDPKTPFVADFIGKMNFLHGEYLGSDAAGAVVRLPGEVDIAANRLNGSSDLFTAGKRVKIAVRPERLKLAPRGEGGPFAIPVIVEAAIFVGSFHVVLVRIAGVEEPLHVQLPASGAGPVFRGGDSVDLVAEREAVRLFPTEL
ncbi:ABC transporter ATP-binding protein [Pseudochelatococcus sp. B33]